MSASVGVLYAVLAMLAWGFSDFFAKLAVGRLGPVRSVFWVQGLQVLPFFAIYALFRPDFLPPDAILLAAAGVLNGMGFLFFYRALGKGQLSIISPIVASWAVISAALGLVLLGEVISKLQSFAISLVFIGIVLASFHYADLRRLNVRNALPGVRDGLFSVVCFGFCVFLFGVGGSRAGWVVSALFYRFFAGVFVALASGPDISRLSVRPGAIPLLALLALLDGIGLVAFGAGAASEYIAIVSPVSAASPLICVILARLFLGERISANQFLGVLLILAGVVILAF